MNVERRTRVKISMSLAEFIATLKSQNPHDLYIQGLPKDGKGAAIETFGGARIDIQYEKETT